MARSFEDRFWAKVNKAGPVPEARPNLGPCWLWLGEISQYGYGRFWTEAPKYGPRHRSHAHRVAWDLANGEIADGLEPDHLCRNRRCVNPGHLELVTGRENTVRGIGPSARNTRKTHCPRGHPYDLVLRGGRARGCRVCAQVYQAAYYRHRAAV